MKIKITKAILFILVVFYSKNVFSITIPYEFNLGSENNMIRFVNQNSPHHYSATLRYQDQELKSYLCYGQKNEFIDATIGIGEIYNYTFDNQLLNHATIENGVVLKWNILPMMIRNIYTGYSNFTYINLYQFIGIGYYFENFDSISGTSTPKDRGTISAGLKYEIPNSVSLEGIVYMSNLTESSSVSQNSGVGTNLNAKFFVNDFLTYDHTFSINAISWSWQKSIGLAYIQKETYLDSFQSDLSKLRDCPSNAIIFGYYAEQRSGILKPYLSFQSGNGNYLLQLGMKYQFDNHMRFSGSFQKTKDENRVLFGMTIDHILEM